MKLDFLPTGSPDCPLIRLYEFDRIEAARLRKIVDSLAFGSRQAVPLHEEAWVEPLGGCKLDLCLAGQDLGVVQIASFTFRCLLTRERWSDMNGLLQPFSETYCSGYQWLNEDGEVSLLLSHTGTW
jgi:hypothetical protein